MSTMLSAEMAPAFLMREVEKCSTCEAKRRPRMFVCDYHEGWWDGHDAGHEAAEAARGGQWRD